MTVDEMSASMAQFLKRCYATIEVKNPDYHPEGVPMLEVFRAAAEANISPQQVLWGHLRKQLSAVRSYVIDHTLQSEPLDSRLIDVVNYSALIHFLETHYPSLIHSAWQYVYHQLPCEKSPGTDSRWCVVQPRTTGWCDRCILLDWLHQEAARWARNS